MRQEGQMPPPPNFEFSYGPGKTIFFHIVVMHSVCLLYTVWTISDAGIHDRVVIQELLKTVAQSHQLETSTQREFKG